MSDPAPPPPPPSEQVSETSTTSPDHAGQISALVDELRDLQRATRRTLIVGSLVLLGIMLLFGWGLYSTVTKNLSAEQLEPALMERVEARTPELQRKATEALTLAMPTYQELARAKMTEITPELRAEARDEFDRLPGVIEERLSGRMQDLQSSVESHIGDQIKERFDTLPPERVEALSLHLADEFHRAGTEVQASLEERYGQQLQRLQQTLSGFDVSAPAGMSDQDLQLKLIENAALLVVHLTQNPDELPKLPKLQPGEIKDSSSDQDPVTASPRTPTQEVN